jgi:hypothetical protein
MEHVEMRGEEARDSQCRDKNAVIRIGTRGRDEDSLDHRNLTSDT